MSVQQPKKTEASHISCRIYKNAIRKKARLPPVFKHAISNPRPPHHSGFKKAIHYKTDKKGKIGKAPWIMWSLPPILLLVISLLAVGVYHFIRWPEQWESRCSHVVLFLFWTIAWHASIHGALAKNIAYHIRCQLRWRLGLRPGWVVCWLIPLILALIIPPSAAIIGELLQGVVPGSGHAPEWAGAGFSLLGVACGWAVFGAWTYAWPRKISHPKPRSLSEIGDRGW